MANERYLSQISLLRLLKKGYPGAHYDIVGTPALDYRLLGDVLQAYLEIAGETGTPKDSIRFVGVSVFILDLHAFRGRRPLTRGLRGQLSNLFGIAETGVSHKLRSAKEYFEVNKSFRHWLLELASAIKAKTGIHDPNEKFAFYYSLCEGCKHFDIKTFTCSPFPEGIPSDFLRAKRDHVSWEPNQIGVTAFEKI
jgi:hypothetical protein